MITIRLFCVAGMLSNLLVGKMRDAAKLKELEVDIQALPESKMSKALEGVDVVLLGPQIAYRLPSVKLLCEPLGIISSVIPMTDFGMMNGAKILDMAISLVEEMKEKQEREGQKEKNIEEELIDSDLKRELFNETVIEGVRGREIENEMRKEKIDIEIQEPYGNIKLKTYESMTSGIGEYEEKCNKIELINNKVDEGLGMEVYNNIINKIRELILNAEKEVFINTNIDISEFKEEIVEISQRGVRLTVVSFKEYTGEELPIDKLYTYIDEKNRNKKLIIKLVIDNSNALVADINYDKDENSVIITDNPILISVISQNILNNIYLLKLRDNIAFKLKEM